MKFLGIRNGHDCNFTYTDGRTVKYIKLERTTQIKHYHWYLYDAVGDDMPQLLQMAQKILNFNIQELDGICIGLDPANHLLDRSIQENELYYRVDTDKSQFWAGIPCPIYSIDHHYAHALSNWPLTDITTIKTHFVFDGSGDHKRSHSIFQNNELVDSSDYAENFGLSRILELIGENYGIEGLVLDISGKLMALKAFHTLSDDQITAILNNTQHLEYKQMHQFMNFFFNDNVMKTNERFRQLVSRPELLNAAHLLHEFANTKLPDYLSTFVNNHEPVTYSGGTAQNTIVNTALRNKFNNIIIPPHSPDDGISLGCVELLRQLFNQEPFDNSGFPYWQSDETPNTLPTQATIDRTAELLAQGKIVGWYQGNGEIGPRALGNRSILMDPSIKNGKDIINEKVKHRESYRPFGASILAEKTNKFFDCDYASPYMLYVIESINKDEYKAIQHVDGTCRIQTVEQQPQTEVYYNLISRFEHLTGIPMVLNTSLNVNGKPIAGYIDNALELYKNTELDVLVIGNDIIVKP